MTHDEFLELFVKIESDSRQSWVRLTEDSCWVVSKHFHRLTGISLEEFYVSKVDIKKCICGNDTYWLRLARGFSKYCSRSCQSRDRSIKMWESGVDLSKMPQLVDGHKNIFKNKEVDRDLYLYCSLNKEGNYKIGCSSNLNRPKMFGSVIKTVKFPGNVGFKIEQHLLKATEHLMAPCSDFREGYTETRLSSVIHTEEFKSVFGDVV